MKNRTCGYIYSPACWNIGCVSSSSGFTTMASKAGLALWSSFLFRATWSMESILFDSLAATIGSMLNFFLNFLQTCRASLRVKTLPLPPNVRIHPANSLRTHFCFNDPFGRMRFVESILFISGSVLRRLANCFATKVALWFLVFLCCTPRHGMATFRTHCKTDLMGI